MKIDCDCQPNCHKRRGCKCGCGVQIASVTIPASLGTSEKGQPNAPENGAYKNAVVRYEADNTVFFYTSEGIPVKVGYGVSSVFSVNGKTGYVVLTTDDIENTSHYQTAEDVAAAVGAEALIRGEADSGLQTQIDALAVASDVTDVVGTYAALQEYDTSKLTNNDIIKVLQDETHDDETTYYRWATATETFTLIGEEGPYYTKSAADSKFQEKLIAGTNISIASDGKTISATDTTYSAFTGTDGQTAGTSGLVPAPATTDANKFLNADGTWGTVNTSFATGEAVSATSLYSALGSNTTGVVKQAYVPRYTGRGQQIRIGSGTIYGFSISLKNGLTQNPDQTNYNNCHIVLDTAEGINMESHSYGWKLRNLPFTGATSDNDGRQGAVPKPLTADINKFLRGDGTWADGGPATFTTNEWNALWS